MKFSLKVLAAMMVVLFGAQAAQAAAYSSLASFQGATSGLTLINFDTDPLGNNTPGSGPIGSTYASWGVVFPSGNDFSASFAGPISSPNGWINNSFQSSAPFFDANITVSGITAVGVWNVLYSEGQPTILSAYDSSNNLLGTATSDSNTQNQDFMGLTTSTDIAYITVTLPNYYGWGLDDLYIGQAGSGPTPTPEPASLAMLVLGVASLGLMRRRAK